MAKKNITDETLITNIVVNGDEGRKAILDIEEATRKLNTENKSLIKQRDKLVAQGKKNTQEYKNLTKEITAKRKAIKANNADLEKHRKGLDLSQLTAKELRTETKRLKRAFDNAVPGTKEYKEYEAQLTKVKERTTELKSANNATGSAISQLKSNVKGIGPALIATFSIGVIVDFTAKLYNTIQLFRELKHETKQLTGLQGEMLDEAVSKTKALGETFNTDYKDNLIAANALSRQFGVEYTTALDAIEKGYLAGADASGDMLEQLAEYAPLMNEANISLDQMVALISQTEKNGVFNDKGIDAIKEGMLAIREGTNATREAIGGLGLDTNKIYADLKAGNVTYFDVLKEVSTKLGEVEEQSPEVGQAVADIFKGAGEDAGLQYLQSIKDIDLELNGLIDTTDDYTILKQEEISINERLNDTWVQLTSTGGVLNRMMLKLKSIAADVLKGVSLLGKSFEEMDKEAAQRAEKNSVAQSIKDEIVQYESYQKKIKELLKDRYDYAEQKERYLQGLYQSIRRAEESGRSQEVTQLKAAIDAVTNYEINKEKEKQSKLSKIKGASSGSSSGSKKSNKNSKRIREHEQMLKTIQGLEEKALLAKQELEEREIQQIVNKYDKLLEKVKEGSEEEARLKELIRNEIQAKELEQEERFEQEKEKVRLKYNLLTNDEKKASEIAALKEFHNQKLISTEEFEQAKKGIEDAYKLKKQEEKQAEEDAKIEKVEAELQTILENEALTDQQRYEAQIARLDEFLANKEISEEEHEKRVSALKFQHTQLRFQQAQQMFSAIGNLVSQAKNYELSQIKEVTKRKGESEESFLKRKEAVEKKKKEVNKKYALVELLTTIGKTVASTSLGIMQAYAQMGPVAGSIFAAVIGTIGALQIGQAKKEYDRVKGYEKGKWPVKRFTRTDGKKFDAQIKPRAFTQTVTQPTYFADKGYLAGENGDELIVDAPVFRSLRPEVIDEIYYTRNRVHGFEQGNYPQQTATSSNNDQMLEMMQMMLETQNRLNYNLENPAPSLALYGEDEIDKIKNNQQEKEQAREGAIIR